MNHDPKHFTRLKARLLAMTALAGIGAVAAYPAGDARAAGFALKEQSATAQGNSFAGATAGAEDVTYMFFNPAGLVRHEGNQAAVVLSYIAPNAETTDAAGGVGGSPVGDGGKSAVVPAAYLLWSLSPDLKLGLGINSPFGLKTEYDPTWAGRLHGIKSELTTINLNPAVAYRLNDIISIGAGLQIQYADVSLTSDITGANVIGEATGDSWGYGVTLGILAELSSSTRLGLGYRSRIDHELEGDFTRSDSGFVDTISADFTSPDQVTAGFYHEFSEQFAVMGEVGWTGWSSFDEIRLIGDNIGTFSVTPEDWDNAWFYGLGATWRANEKLTLRGGIAYDQSPVPDNRRTPRIPDEDRTWVSLGIGYKVSPGFSIDAGYTHIFVDDPAINLPAGYTTPAAPGLTATFDASVDILALNAVLKF